MFYNKKALRMSYGVNPIELRSAAILFSINEIKQFGSTLVFAPHPDDESLGCGGTIALLRSMGNMVHVVFVSDGSMSHPGSRKFPADVLSGLRKKEALNALFHMAVPAEQVIFLGLKDGDVPARGGAGFNPAVEMIHTHLERIRPDTVVVPWRRDTHADHRACWQLVTDAILLLSKKPIVLEYPLWFWERGDIDDMPRKEEINIRSVNISKVIHLKQEAIAAHQSQVTRMIDDDPDGFWLSPEVIAHFMKQDEIYFVSKP